MQYLTVYDTGMFYIFPLKVGWVWYPSVDAYLR
jgi:hypothetical protein